MMQICTSIHSLRYFNPRSHEGNDVNLNVIFGTYKKFQSTFPRGERQITVCGVINSMIFQSTFPRGERRVDTRSWKSQIVDFNPRSHEGNDEIGLTKSESTTISIHVPTRGTTAIFPNFKENIFLNTVNLYISFSFSCYTTIISLLFIHFCALFMVRIPIYFYVRFIFAHKSHNKNTVRRNSSIDPYMFYFGFILIPQIVKSQTIYFFIYNIR